MKRTDASTLNAHPHSLASPSIAEAANTLPLFTDDRFNALFDSSGEALIVIDQTGGIQQANSRARELLRLKNLITPRARLLEFLAVLSAMDFAELSTQSTTSTALTTRDAMLATGFPIKITLRAALPGSQDLLLCLEEGSVVQQAERKSRQLEAEISSTPLKLESFYSTQPATCASPTHGSPSISH